MALQFKLKFTSPFDFSEIFFNYMPWFNKLRQSISCILEFAMVLSISCQFKAEVMFYAAVLTTLRYKGIRMTDMQATILKSLSDSWEAIN